uniref:F-box domain-containing protein n=1 Tax=Quercus lobata TaxID=97700 RepID=A0A7N2M325_QUELO
MSRPTEKLRLLTERVLDDDIAFDILTRLPVKSLIRFRCVSKSWYSTITNPIFIATHFKLNEAKSLSNKNSHNGYLLYTSVTEGYSFHEDLRTLVYNRDRTVTEISRFDENNGDHMIYLWNPSIRKFKMLAPALLTAPFDCATLGLAYHSQKNDFKILRLVSFPGSLGEPDPLTEAEIMLPLDFLDVYQSYLTVFKGSLAYIIISNRLATGIIMCHIWVMKEYGVAESWTRKCVPIDWFHHFHGCTDNGELLIMIFMGLISIDPENLFQNSLITESNIRWAGYAANSIESLVLLDGVNLSSEYKD